MGCRPSRTTSLKEYYFINLRRVVFEYCMPKLFNQITDVIEQLKAIQAETEEMYIDSDDADK